MTSKELRSKYLEFFKARGHAVIPSASLIPENDPTALFTGSGMQPMVPYLLGEDHPEGTRISDSQKCIRTIDIDKIGDTSHLTFFEMLGNWSLGDYFKKEQISWIFEFWTKVMGFDPNRIYVSVFGGNEKYGLAKDMESVEIWKKEFKKAGIDAKDIANSEIGGMGDGRIFYYGDENWWSRVGEPDNMPVGEPGGPDSEMFYDVGAEKKIHENSEYKNQPCHINCDCGRFIEIGNNVFIEFIKTAKGFEPLPKKNIDFGGGLERIVMISQEKNNVYETDLFTNIINKISRLSKKEYGQEEKTARAMRIIADHIRAATFIIGDPKGVTPSNTDQGYIVRRLLRRAIRYGKQLGIKEDLWTKEIAKIVIHDYAEAYPELGRNANFIVEQFKEEEEKFAKTLVRGLAVLNKELVAQIVKRGQPLKVQPVNLISGPNGIEMLDFLPSIITGKWLFNFYQTFGFPLEMVLEELKAKGCYFSDKDYKNFYSKFNEELKKHQELSRTASAGKFKGGLADASEETKKLHTAAHLLLAALRKVLGENVVQKGSNITAERLRFDFSHKEKMSLEQIKEVEKLVNEAIAADLPVNCEEMPLPEAKKKGAMGVFESKYGEKVKVYKVGKEKPFSYEICGGPHVNRTGELGHFKIMKEESSSAGVRRIKAVLE